MLHSKIVLQLLLAAAMILSSEAVWLCNKTLDVNILWYHCGDGDDAKEWNVRRVGILTNMNEYPVQKAVGALKYGAEDTRVEIDFRKLEGALSHSEKNSMVPLRVEDVTLKVNAKSVVIAYQKTKTCKPYCRDLDNIHAKDWYCSDVTVYSELYSTSAQLNGKLNRTTSQTRPTLSLFDPGTCFHDFMEYPDTILNSTRTTILEDGTKLITVTYDQGFKTDFDRSANEMQSKDSKIDQELLVAWLNSNLHVEALNPSRETGLFWRKYEAKPYGLAKSNLTYRLPPGQGGRVFQAMILCGEFRVFGWAFPVIYERETVGTGSECESPEYEPVCLTVGGDKPGSPFSIINDVGSDCSDYFRQVRDAGMEITYGLKGPLADKVDEYFKAEFLDKMEAHGGATTTGVDWKQLRAAMTFVPYGVSKRVVLPIINQRQNYRFIVFQLVGQCNWYRLYTSLVAIVKVDAQNQCQEVSGDLPLACSQIQNQITKYK